MNTGVVASTAPAYVPPPHSSNGQQSTMIEPVNVTSVGFEVRAVEPMPTPEPIPTLHASDGQASVSVLSLNAKLLIERRDGSPFEFRISGTESIIGRWDADNGVFPDVDLDSHDSEAKVSRRHAKIRRSGLDYVIEDVGSTNGTYINRGRRLMPGTPQVIKNGDEIIVGKTFLRFQTLD